MLWGAFFLWPIISGRSSGRRSDSIGDFSYRLGVIGKTGGHGRRRRSSQPPAIPVAMPPAIPPARPLGAPGTAGVQSAPRALAVARPAAMSRSQRRRRDVLLLLGVGVLSSMLLAILGGNPVFWLVQGVTDVLLAGYLVLLLRMKQTASERRAKVHYLPGPVPTAPLVLRRSASS